MRATPPEGPRRSATAGPLRCALGLLLLLALGSGCTAPYFANAARDFGGTLTGASADMGAMLRGISVLCRRQADLAYLRGRVEDPTDRHMVLFRDRLTSRFSGRAAGIEARCAVLEKQVSVYQQMHGALVAYGAALRALGETESADFRDSFADMGDTLNRLAITVKPDEPELGRAMLDGANAVNQLLRMALSARTERDIRHAILAAAPSVRRILDRLDKADLAYREQVGQYTEVARALLDQLERTTMPRVPGTQGRLLDVLSFYDLALRMNEDLQRLDAGVRLYGAALAAMRQAHEVLVTGAQQKITAKMTFESVRQSSRELRVYLQDITDQLDSLRLRGAI